MITLYHRTSPEAADSIVSQGEFKPGWGGQSFFSTQKNAGKQYGSATVAIQVPKSEFNKFETHQFFGSSQRIVVVSPSRLSYLGVQPKRIN